MVGRKLNVIVLEPDRYINLASILFDNVNWGIIMKKFEHIGQYQLSFYLNIFTPSYQYQLQKFHISQALKCSNLKDKRKQIQDIV